MDMARGTLRIFLGAAAGAGTTYSMLREAHRLAACGRDVAVGIAADHGRQETRQLLDGLDVVAPRLPEAAHGAEVPELDVEAVLARKPEVAVVDEYAHVNAPGSSRNEHRWQDIEELLAAGTDVLTALSVQHLASLKDVVAAVTGEPGDETVADAVVRRADYIELVDIAPELLRQRVADGKVFPKDRIEAALANGFRLGNLIALREIALIWLADRVDEGLASYRRSQGITATWPARERVVVGLSGGPEGEMLIRRAARILSRVNGGDLLAVHVRRAEERAATSGQLLDAQRHLATDLGGTCHTVSGEDTAESLLQYARSVNATQIVIGASPGRLWERVLGIGVGSKVVRGSGDIDVHIVSHPQGGGGLPKPAPGGLGRARTTIGFVLAVLLPVLLTAALAVSPDLNLATHALVHLTGVMAVAFIGGLWPAVLAAVLGSLLLNYFQTDPVGTLNISDPQNVFALLVFLGAAVAVSLVVGLSARRAREALRARAEATTLADLAHDALLADDTVAAFMDKLRETFQVRSAGLFTVSEGAGSAWELQAFAGDAALPSPDAVSLTDSVELADARTALVLSGRALTAGDRLLLAAHGAHLLLLRQRHALQRTLQSTAKMAEGNNVRTAILGAVGHDLRTPLAGIKLAVTALRRQGRRLPEEVQAEMLGTIESYTERLDALISNLLDMSRISSGSAAPLTAPVTWRDAIEDALRGLPADRIRIDLAPGLPAVDADQGMLERVIANIVENALKYAPDSDVIIVGVSAGTRGADDGGTRFGELHIVDHGQGVPAAAVEGMFQPFQRLDDAPAGLGMGLGLAVAKGFTEAMGGQLLAEPTPGGGLTMIIRLPLPAGRAMSNVPGKAGTSTS
ncbi:two-component system sensor histidine kinase KdpD [Arthrobacter sp. SLBN-112]|nr:two-component system sensor histidine kinase KdpD [Arthrobacter sp. SLBN-112]